jgi:hypothetical protein
MDAGWWVKLEGDAGSLQQLAGHFTHPDLRVVEDAGTFYLGSTRMNGVSSTDEVREIGSSLLAAACGAEAIELGRLEPPHVVAAVHIREDGTKHHLITVGASLRMTSEIHARVERPQPDGSVAVYDVSPPLPRPAALVGLAKSNAAVDDALAILGRSDLRWHDLYHVYELVEADVGVAMFGNGWTTRTTAKRFKQTANSRRVVGREARHGHDRHQPPKNPMTFSEAVSFVIGLARQWINAQLPTPPATERLIEIRPAGDTGARVSDTIP